MTRSFLRLAAAAAAVVLPFATTGAWADPEDGKGCAGLSAVPAAYVCIVSYDPGTAPSVAPTGTETVLFESDVCYVVDCEHVRIAIPDYAVTGPTPPTIVVWYEGQEYTVGSVPTPPSVAPYVALLMNAIEHPPVTVPNLSGTRPWLDCTVESETDDRVDLYGGDNYYGYNAYSCYREFGPLS